MNEPQNDIDFERGVEKRLDKLTKRRHRIRVGITICGFVAALSIMPLGAFVIAKSNEGAAKPAYWCIERLKEKDLFEENGIKQYACTVTEASYHNLDLSFEPESFKDAFFIEIVYDAKFEKWLCFIDYENTVWVYIKKEQVKSVQCYLLERKDI